MNQEAQIIEPGVLNIRGKIYTTVAKRLFDFRTAYPIELGYGIETEVTERGDLVHATAKITRGTLVLATGHAEEERGDGFVNKTAAIENAETSAVGRALANAGFGGGDAEFASADELEADYERVKELYGNVLKHMDVLRDNLGAVGMIKQSIAEYDSAPQNVAALDPAIEAWGELDQDEVQRPLWLATTKGGVFTTREREVMKCNDWSSRRAEVFNEES